MFILARLVILSRVPGTMALGLPPFDPTCIRLDCLALPVLGTFWLFVLVILCFAFLARCFVFAIVFACLALLKTRDHRVFGSALKCYRFFACAVVLLLLLTSACLVSLGAKAINFLALILISGACLDIVVWGLLLDYVVVLGCLINN